jgi:AraC-like DNA-binding protein
MALSDSRHDLSNPDLVVGRGNRLGYRTPVEFSDRDSHLHWVEWETGQIEAIAPPSDHVHINVVMAGTGRFFRSDALGTREDAFRPGLVNVTLPDAGGGVIACDGVSLGALGMSLSELQAGTAEYLDGRDCDFERIAHRLWDSALISAVLMQLSQAARTGQLGASLLDHSAGVIALAIAQQMGGAISALGRDRGSLSAVQQRRVEAFVDERLGDELSVDDMARIVGVGPRHFTRLFRNSFGVAPYAYLLERRLLAAQRLIRQANASVTDIALDCGFSGSAAFSAAYRRRFGVRPSDDRRAACR